MTGFENALVLVLLLTALSIVGRRLPVPLPVVYVAGATVAAFVPGFPRIELDPGFFFLCFVPPLLFSDGWLMPLRDFLSAKRPILTLATGLVVLTTVCVGLVAHWLVPTLPLAMAFALGAVVSPTDAVATAAITQRLKVPARLNTILNGESLMNDATGLVAFKVALGAMAAGAFSLRAATFEFVVLAGGGLVVGLIVSWAVGWARDTLRCFRSTDTYVEVTVSLMTPYAAYLAANALNVSNILAVVAAGLYAGWRDPVRMDVATRQAAWNVWSVVLFWLNGLAFVLLGLQLPAILASVTSMYSPWQLVGFTLAVSTVAMLVRLLWMFPGGYIPHLLFRRALVGEPRPQRGELLVAGWAGMRGTITLAAALSIPVTLADGTPFPGRDIVIFLSAGVILVTLLLQGTTLETVIRRLGVQADDSAAREEHRARVAAVRAGLQSLANTQSAAAQADGEAARRRVLAEYELRLAELTADGPQRDDAARQRADARHLRFAALRAERAALDALWRDDAISDETYRPLQALLDHEEAALGPAPAEAEV
jgi:CPA1 family monovalent cation:H+ antiporter